MTAPFANCFALTCVGPQKLLENRRREPGLEGQSGFGRDGVLGDALKLAQDFGHRHVAAIQSQDLDRFLPIKLLGIVADGQGKVAVVQNRIVGAVIEQFEFLAAFAGEKIRSALFAAARPLLARASAA